MPRSEHIAVVTFYKVDHSSLPDASSLVEKLCDPNAKCASKWCIHTRRCKYKSITVCYLFIYFISIRFLFQNIIDGESKKKYWCKI